MFNPFLRNALSNEKKSNTNNDFFSGVKTLLGVGATGLAGYTAFNHSNPNLKGKSLNQLVQGIKDSSKPVLQSPVGVIGKKVREEVIKEGDLTNLFKSQKNNEIESLFNQKSTSDVTSKLHEILRSKENEKIAHLSSLLDMVNDSELNLPDVQRQNLNQKIRSLIEISNNSITNDVDDIANFVNDISRNKSSVDKYLNLYQQNKSVAGLLVSGNRFTESVGVNPYDLFNGVKAKSGNSHIQHQNLSLLNQDIFDLFKGTNDESVVQNVTLNRYNRLNKILGISSQNNQQFNSFDVSFDVTKEMTDNKKGHTFSIYAKVKSKASGAPKDPIIVPLFLGQTSSGRYVRTTADLGNASLVHDYYFNAPEVNNVLKKNISPQQMQKEMQSLMKNSRYEDAVLNILEGDYKKNGLFNINKYERNNLMQTMRGLGQHISQNAKYKFGYTGVQAKSQAAISGSIALFMNAQELGKDIDYFIPKLASLGIGFQGPPQGQAGLKTYEVNSQRRTAKAAYVNMNEDPTSNKLIHTPFNIHRKIGIKDEAVLPGAARVAQLYGRQEALLGFAGSVDDTMFSSYSAFKDSIENATFGRANLKVLGMKGGDLLSVDKAFKDAEMVAANTGIIINFNESAKKGQKLGLADAMSYSGGSMIVSRPISKSFKIRQGMKNFAIYNSQVYKDLLSGNEVNLFGDELDNFFKTYGDESGNVVLGEKDEGFEYIRKSQTTKGLRLKMIAPRDTGKAETIRIIGEEIAPEFGPKAFSEGIKGVNLPPQHNLGMSGLTRAVAQASGSETLANSFMKDIVAESFGLKSQSIQLTSQDIVTKAPTYLSSLMYGGLRVLGFQDTELENEIDSTIRSKFVSDPLKLHDPGYLADEVGADEIVKDRQKKYFKEAARSMFDFLERRKGNQLASNSNLVSKTVTPELIGSIMTPAHSLEAYQEEFNGKKMSFFEKLLREKGYSDADVDKYLTYANKGLFVGGMSMFAGTPSSVNKDKLAKVEPRFANFLMGSLKVGFNMSTEESADLLADVLKRQTDLPEKLKAIVPLMMTAKSFSNVVNQAAYNLELEEFKAAGDLIEVDSNFVKQFLNANVSQDSATELASFLKEQKKVTGNAFGAIINVEDLFKHGPEGFEKVNQTAMDEFLEKIGGKKQIVMPLSDTLDYMSGVEIKQNETDLKIQSEMYRRINDIFSNIREGTLSQRETQQKESIRKAMYYVGELQGLVGHIQRNIISGRVSGSATLEGKGIKLGILDDVYENGIKKASKEQTTILFDDKDLEKKAMQKFNKAFTASKGYAAFIDTQAFMTMYGSLKEEGTDDLATFKSFMFGMMDEDIVEENGELKFVNNMLKKDLERVSGTTFRNPQIGLTNISPFVDLYRFDTEGSLSTQKLHNVLGYSDEGNRLLTSLDNFMRGDGFKNALGSKGKQIVDYVTDSMNNADPNNKFSYLNMNIIHMLNGLNKKGVFSSLGSMKVGLSLNEIIANKQASLQKVNNTLLTVKNITPEQKDKFANRVNFLSSLQQREAKIEAFGKQKTNRITYLTDQLASMTKDKYLKGSVNRIDNISNITSQENMSKYFNVFYSKRMNTLGTLKSNVSKGLGPFKDLRTGLFEIEGGRFVSKLEAKNFYDDNEKVVMGNIKNQSYQRQKFKTMNNMLLSQIGLDEKRIKETGSLIDDLKSKSGKFDRSRFTKFKFSIDSFLKLNSIIPGEKESTQLFKLNEKFKGFLPFDEEVFRTATYFGKDNKVTFKDNKAPKVSFDSDEYLKHLETKLDEQRKSIHKFIKNDDYLQNRSGLTHFKELEDNFIVEKTSKKGNKYLTFDIDNLESQMHDDDALVNKSYKNTAFAQQVEEYVEDLNHYNKQKAYFEKTIESRIEKQISELETKRTGILDQYASFGLKETDISKASSESLLDTHSKFFGSNGIPDLENLNPIFAIAKQRKESGLKKSNLNLNDLIDNIVRSKQEYADFQLKNNNQIKDLFGLTDYIINNDKTIDKKVLKKDFLNNAEKILTALMNKDLQTFNALLAQNKAIGYGNEQTVLASFTSNAALGDIYHSAIEGTDKKRASFIKGALSHIGQEFESRFKMNMINREEQMIKSLYEGDDVSSGKLKTNLTQDQLDFMKDQSDKIQNKLKLKQEEKIKNFQFLEYDLDASGNKQFLETKTLKDGTTYDVYKTKVLTGVDPNERYGSIDEIKNRLNQLQDERFNVQKQNLENKKAAAETKLIEIGNKKAEIQTKLSEQRELHGLQGDIDAKRIVYTKDQATGTLTEIGETDKDVKKYGKGLYKQVTVTEPLTYAEKQTDGTFLQKPVMETYIDPATNQKAQRPVMYSYNKYDISDIQNLNTIDDLEDASSLKQKAIQKETDYKQYQADLIKEDQELEIRRQQAINAGLDPNQSKSATVEELTDQIMSSYVRNYGKAVGSGAGFIYFPEFYTDFTLESTKPNSKYKPMNLNVRTDISRAGVGDFDGDIYQVIMNNKKTSDAFKKQIQRGVSTFQRQSAVFTLNMEILKKGMDQVAKNVLNVVGQGGLSFGQFVGSEVKKEEILKGAIGAIDVTMKTGVIGSVYSMMESPDDLTKIRRTHLAAQTLLSASQEIVVLKSKSLELATNMAMDFKQTLDDAFNKGDTSGFEKFLKERLFKDTIFEEGVQVTSTKTSNIPYEMAVEHNKALMNEKINFNLDEIIEGFRAITNTVRNRNVGAYASNKMLGNLLATNKVLDSEAYNRIVYNRDLLESIVSNQEFKSQEMQNLFDQVAFGKQGQSSSADLIIDSLKSASNFRLTAAAGAALGASYLLSSDYDTEPLSMDDAFSDSRVNDKIASKSLAEGYSRDPFVSSSNMQQPFYKNMVNRVQSPGETYVAQNRSYLMQGQASSMEEANYLNNIVLKNGGISSMMVSDNRLPITGNYIDRLMGE